MMSPRDKVIMHDLNLIVQSACAKKDDVNLGLIDETDVAYIEQLFRQAPPFYTAADYQRPMPAKDGLE